MDTVKFIVSHLSKEPFNKNYNVITFDSLNKSDLLQVLSDVFVTIDPQNRSNLNQGDLEQVATRLYDMLRMVNYKLPNNMDPIMFQRRLAMGDKHIIHPILKWLLSNSEELKSRAYLSKFVTKVEIPTDTLGDAETAAMYEQYEIMVGEFGKLYKESVEAKEKKASISELKSDCTAIEKEKEIVSNRIAQLQKKVEQLPNRAAFLAASRSLRIEKEKKKTVLQQTRDEISAIQQYQHRLSRLAQQLQDSKKYSVNLSVEAMVKKLEEEVYVTSYIANQKFPRDLDQQKRELEVYRSVCGSGKMTESTNGIVATKIQSLSQQVNNLTGSKLSSSNNAIDETMVYRQQAAMVAQKKDNMVESFSQLKNELSRLNDELEDKKQRLQELLRDVGTVLNADEFQAYVQKLRGRSVVYKHHRSRLAQLKSEENILSKTLQALQAKGDELRVDTGVEFSADDSRTTSSKVTTYKGDNEAASEEELFAQIAKLMADISTRKTTLLPLINEIKPLQSESRDLKAMCEEKKKVYDRTSAVLDSNLAKLTRDVNELQEERDKIVAKTQTLEEQVRTDEANLERANAESRICADKNNVAPTFKERLNHKIAEEEKVGRLLKEEQKSVHEAEAEQSKQRELFNNLYVLMEQKHKCLEIERQNSGTFHLERGAETLVLQ